MKDLPIRDQVLAYLTVEGWTNEEISSALSQWNLPPETIRLKLTDERISEKARNLHYQLTAVDSKKRFEDILPHAIDVMEAALRDPAVKPQVKLSAAENLIDRVLGKPKQTIDHEGSLVRALLERLQSKDVPEAIPVSFKELMPGEPINPNQVITPIVKNAQNPNFQEDTIDSWIKQNLKSRN